MTNKRPLGTCLLMIWIGMLTVPHYAEARSLEPLRLKLHWVAHAEFAGIFMALEKGWYEEEGIALTVYPRSLEEDDVVNGLRSGHYDIAMDIGSVVINARARGLPLRAFAAAFQASPLGLLARADESIHTVADLKDKVIGFYVPSDLWILRVMLNHHGLQLSDILLREISLNYTELTRRRVDALFAFEMMEPVILSLQGHRTKFLKSAESGFNVYGSVYFADEQFISRNFSLLARFLRATFRGWRYVFQHPEEATDLVMNKYFPKALLINGDLTLTRRQQLLYTKLIRRYIDNGDDDFAIGYMNEVIWNKTIEQMKSAHALLGPIDVKRVYTNNILNILYTMEKHEKKSP